MDSRWHKSNIKFSKPIIMNLIYDVWCISSVPLKSSWSNNYSFIKTVNFRGDKMIFCDKNFHNCFIRRSIREIQYPTQSDIETSRFYFYYLFIYFCLLHFQGIDFLLIKMLNSVFIVGSISSSLSQKPCPNQFFALMWS